jgi:predicted regulator of Ras-like GTPase activity (Roadblock/LC7/MglB family)
MLEHVRGLPGVHLAVVLSNDGLVITRTGESDRDVADKLAAGCAGLIGVARALQDPAGIGGDFRQVFVEWSGGFVFVRSAGEKSSLAVFTDATVNPALIAQGMAEQVLKIGKPALSTASRS